MTVEIKKMANELAVEYQTRDPFVLADYMGIIYRSLYLGKMSGYYLFYEGRRCIVINSAIEDIFARRIVMAHEIGHAVLHTNNRCMFFADTLYSRSKPEREANKFAAEFLVPDDIIFQHPGYTIKQVAGITGYSEDILRYKVEEKI